MASPIESLLQGYSLQSPVETENALKEKMQEIALAGLARAKFFDKAAFYGGTALRIFYRLPRFSEDLDFTLYKTDPKFSLKPYFPAIEGAMRSFGLEVAVTEKNKGEGREIESAFLKANTRVHLLQIDATKALAGRVDANKTMEIKFEVDVYPPQRFETEVKVLLPPISASVKMLRPSSLFAGKMHAVLFRKWKENVKGRDFYDLLWFIGKSIPVHLPYLEEKIADSLGEKAPRPLTEEKVRELLTEKIAKTNFTTARKDVERFLRHPEEVEAWSPEFFLAAIENLQFSPPSAGSSSAT